MFPRFALLNPVNQFSNKFWCVCVHEDKIW